MNVGSILQLAKKSLSFECKSQRLGQSNYDVFRRCVSRPFLRLFEMPESDSSKRAWNNGVNLAVQMQAIFNAQSRAKIQSSRHAQLLKKLDGGSLKLTRVIDV